MSADIQVATKNTKAILAERAAAERARRDEEQRLHAEALKAADDEKKTEIELVMDELTKGEQRLVRMHAATICIANGYAPQRRQEQFDDMTLRIARYMATGVA